MVDNYFMGLDGFVWFTGVVEDRNDPAKLGRVRVRCLGIHTEDKNEIPTEDLPWAHVMHPITDPSMQGMGMTPSFLVEGSWVMGFFRDAEEKQQPIVMGTLPGYSQPPDDLNESTYETIDPIFSDPYAEDRFKATGTGSLRQIDALKQYRENNSDKGFSDPNLKYPQYPNQKSGHNLGESDINRLARNEEKFQHKMLEEKKLNLEKFEFVASSRGSDWSMEQKESETIYPFNHVFESESGHIKEYDDTPEHERIHEYHSAGTYYEIDGGGNRIVHVVGDGYHLIAGSNYVNVKGHANLTVDGDCNTLVKGDYNIKVEGDMNLQVENDFNTTIVGKTTELYEGTFATTFMDAASNVYNTTLDNVSIGAVTDTYGDTVSRSITGAVTERFGSTIDRTISGIQTEIHGAAVNLSSEAGSININTGITFNVNAVTVDLDATTMDLDGTTTNINANTFSLSAPSTNVKYQTDTASGGGAMAISHATTGASVDTPTTPDSDLVLVDITKGILNGENVAKEEELVDSQGPDRTEESGTGSYLTNPDGDYPFPILLTREDNPLAKVAEDLGVNENELDLSAGAAERLLIDRQLEREAPDLDDPTGKKKIKVSDPDESDMLEKDDDGGTTSTEPNRKYLNIPYGGSYSEKGRFKDKEITNEVITKNPGKFFTDGTPKLKFKHNCEINGVEPDLIEIAEKIADDVGYQLFITSGYRSPSRNKSATGAKKSQHLLGRALDIRMKNKTVEERNKFIRVAVKHGIKGIGLYFPSKISQSDFIHIDIKQGPLGKRCWKAGGGWKTQYKWARATLQSLGYYV